MLKNIKNGRSLLLLASALLGLVGLIIYLIVATTGYFVGDAPNAAVTVGSIFYILLTILYVLFQDKLEKFDTIAIYVLTAFLLLAFVFFILDKEEVVGEMLVPVNHPQKQIDAAVTSVVGIVFYILSFLLLAIASFFGKKEAESA